MLIRFLLKLTLLLTLIFAALVGLIRAQPYDDSELRAFLTPPDGCPMPCWQGIRPGITTFEEVRAIIENHPWITNIEYVGSVNESPQSAQIFWDWNGSQPVFASTSGGIVAIENNIVDAITLITLIPLGDVWLSFPETGRFQYTRGGANRLGECIHTVLYTHQNIEVTARLSCQRFWGMASTWFNFFTIVEVSSCLDLITAPEVSCK
jgi:hypothetical protein